MRSKDDMPCLGRFGSARVLVWRGIHRCWFRSHPGRTGSLCFRQTGRLPVCGWFSADWTVLRNCAVPYRLGQLGKDLEIRERPKLIGLVNG